MNIPNRFLEKIENRIKELGIRINVLLYKLNEFSKDYVDGKIYEDALEYNVRKTHTELEINKATIKELQIVLDDIKKGVY